MDFFKRLRKDRKFKKAGEGHQLGGPGSGNGGGDAKQQRGSGPASSSSSAATQRQHQQQQPRELSQAGRAAQERMQRAREQGKASSTSAIKSEARRQLQTEAAPSSATTYRPPSAAAPSKEELARQWKQEADRLQVRVTCPICGHPVRELEKMDHLRDEFKQGLSDMPLPMAAKMVWTLNPREKRELAVKTITAYLNNVLHHPDEDKYRRINKENKAFQGRILGAEGAFEFLKAVGFREQSDEEDGRTFMALPGDVSSSDLELARDLIQSDQKVICRLYRDVRVLKPHRNASLNAAMRVDLPSDFFKLTAEDVKARHQQLQQETDKLSTLRTQTMREAELAQGKKQYRFCLVRVRFPDGLILQGTFHTTDRVSTLRKFVQDSLADEGRAFYLYTHPDRNKVENANETLREAGLVPLRLLNFGWADGEVSKAPVIKQSLLDAMQPLA